MSISRLRLAIRLLSLRLAALPPMGSDRRGRDWVTLEIWRDRLVDLMDRELAGE